jgi:hypothetical protein
VALIHHYIHLRPATQEEMELKALIIDDQGVILESNNDTKSIKWINVKRVKEYTPTTFKKARQSVEIVAFTNESITFSNKNFIKVRKIRKSLKYFCNINKVEIAVK